MIFYGNFYHVSAFDCHCFHKCFPGSDTRVGLVAQKSKEGPDYTLQFKFGTLDVNNFLAKFGIDASEMISSDLSFASSRMGLATLIMQDPEVTGLFSPDGGFEIVATGKIAAPELPADASKFFVIVQDFKEGNSDSANEGYGKPIAAVFALYESIYTFYRSVFYSYHYFSFTIHSSGTSSFIYF